MYQVITNVANYDTVLGYISAFIASVNTEVGGGGAWSIYNNLGTPTVDDTGGANVAGGRVLIAYGIGANNQDVIFGMRSTVSGPGTNCLYMFDGQGTGSAPTVPGEWELPGNSGGAYGLYFATGTSASGICAAGGQPAIRGFQNPYAGPFPSLWMFSNATGDYLHFVLEIAAGRFRHMHIGPLTQFGTWAAAGGGYYGGQYWTQSGLGVPPGDNISIPNSNSSLLPWDNNPGFQNSCEWTVHYVSPNGSSTGAWVSPAIDHLTPTTLVQRRQAVASVRGGFNRMFKNISESLFSGLVPLAPIMVGAVRSSDSPVTLRWIGQIPDVRMVNMTNLIDGQTFAIGADTWQVFSAASKNGAPGQENSGVAGYAYKVIP